VRFLMDHRQAFECGLLKDHVKRPSRVESAPLRGPRSDLVTGSPLSIWVWIGRGVDVEHQECGLAAARFEGH
jgi:hypothetical protein